MTLEELNRLPPEALRQHLEHCCASRHWADAMAARRPWRDAEHLFSDAEAASEDLGDSDWLEAFAHHPKIGNLDSMRKKFAATAHLAGAEQGAVREANEATLRALAEANAAYERQNGFIFIVCATGKSAEEMLALLKARLLNDRATELRNAAAEQRKITRLRLEKLLQ